MASGTPVARLSVRVLPDTSEFGSKLRAQLAKVGNLKVNVDPDLTGFAAKIKAEAARVRDVKVGVDVDRSFADRVGFAAERGISRNASRISSSMADAVGSGVRKAFSFSLGTVKFGAIGVAGATAAAGVGALLLKVVPLVGEVGQLAGLLPLLPAALGGLAGIAGTLMLGLNGLGKAFKDMGDLKKFNKDIEKLRPAARDFAEVVRSDLYPAFKKLQDTVQGKLFAGLGGELRTWKDDLLPALADGFGNIATGLNGVAKNVIKAFGSPKVASAIKTLFGNTGSALTTAGPGFASIITGFSTMSAAASKFFDRFAAAFTNGGAKFEAWVDKIVANGQLDKWVNQGVDAFKNIAGIVGNLSSVIASITRAAGGEGLLNSFNALTGRFAEWAKSDAGQRVFDRMFTTADQVLSALSPIIPALLNLGAALNLGGIAQAVGPQITNIIDALKPAASSLGQLLQDIATPLGKALTSFATFIGPAIDAITPGVKDLFGSLQKIAPDLGSILVDVAGIGSDILSFVADALPGFVGGVKRIVGVIGDIIDKFGGFGAAIATAGAALLLLGGGKGGIGGKGFSLGKTVVGGGLLVDAATNDKATRSAAEFGKNVATAAAAGALLGSQFGILGTIIGGLGGAVVGMVPTFEKGISTLFNTITGKAGDKFVLDPNAPFGLATQVTGKGTNANTDEEKQKIKARLELNKQSKDLIKDLNKYDSDAAQKLIAEKMKFNSKYNTSSYEGALQYSRDIEKALREAHQKTNEEKVRGDKTMFVDSTAAAVSAASNIGSAWGNAATAADQANHRIVDSVLINAPAASGAWSRAAADASTSFGNTATAADGAWTRAAASATWSAQTTQAQFQFASASSAASADRASAAMSGAWSRAGSSAASAAGQADGAWRSAAGNSGSAWQGFYNSFNTNRPAQASAASAQGALNAWSGVGGAASSLGAQFGNGLAAGINSRRGAVQAAANDLAEIAIRAAQTAARIASPSKKMMEIGAYMSEGLAIGIQSNVNMVRSAAASASNAAIDTAAGNMANAASGASGPNKLEIYDVDNVLIGSMDVRSGQKVTQYDRQSAMTAEYSRGV